MHRVCLEGNINEVLSYIEKGSEDDRINGSKDWNYGLEGACMGGHMDIVRLMIKKGSEDNRINGSKEHSVIDWKIDWNNGLRWACKGGDIDIVLLMISQGAMTQYLFGPCRKEYYNKIKYVIKQMNISDCGTLVYEFIL